MTDPDSLKIPTIILDTASRESLRLFNPNEWQGESKGVVESCATEHSVNCYCVERLMNVCNHAAIHCAHHLATLQGQWNKGPWDLSKGRYFAQVSEMHLLIEAFFAGIKSLLDLLVQLLCTENVIATDINGFHRDGDIYGGRVLNALDNNTKVEKRLVAGVIKSLLDEHKADWIDEVIHSRDLLVHPTRYAQQLMFELILTSTSGNLVCKRIIPPRAGQTPISEYVQRQLRNADRFAGAFLAALVKDRSAA